MNNFVFSNSTKAYFGRGCVGENLPAELSKYGDTVMLAYGGGSIKKNGIYDEVTAILEKAGKKVVEFSGIMSNPTYAKVLEGGELVKKHGVGLILGIGGGSVMDCCKAVSMAAVYEGDLWNDFWANIGVVDFTPTPVGFIVTASGTGSECDGGAVITNEETMVKCGHDYHECNARFAMLDPTYTYSVPMKQVLAGSFDTLSHIMECYFSPPDEDNISDDIAEALMKSVIRDLRIAAEKPDDYVARSNLMWASTLGEYRLMKIGKSLDFQCHYMEHQLGAYTDCSHGEGLAVLHPVYYRHLYKHGLSKFVRFAENVWGIPRGDMTDEQLAAAGVEALARFVAEIGLPTTLSEMGITDREMLKKAAYSCAISKGAYKKLSFEEIYEIFLEAI